jgi:hypothetical protein
VFPLIYLLNVCAESIYTKGASSGESVDPRCNVPPSPPSFLFSSSYFPNQKLDLETFFFFS